MAALHFNPALVSGLFQMPFLQMPYAELGSNLHVFLSPRPLQSLSERLLSNGAYSESHRY
jgi:hypothetical protein